MSDGLSPINVFCAEDASLLSILYDQLACHPMGNPFSIFTPPSTRIAYPRAGAELQ